MSNELANTIWRVRKPIARLNVTVRTVKLWYFIWVTNYFHSLSQIQTNCQHPQTRKMLDQIKEHVLSAISYRFQTSESNLLIAQYCLNNTLASRFSQCENSLWESKLQLFRQDRSDSKLCGYSWLTHFSD